MTTPSADSSIFTLVGLRVRVLGIVRGRDIDAWAALSLDNATLVLAWENATPWRLELSGLDGIMSGAAQLTLYLASGDMLELTGHDDLRTFATRLMDAACVVPELTRGLRALGSERGAPGPAHDRWFAPLLAARRAVAGVTDAERQVALIDASTIAKILERTLTELAKEKSPDAPAMQRALSAALLQESEATFVALERLEVAADALIGGAMDTRLIDWRRWVAALRDVFVAADVSWPRAAKVLSHGL